MKLRHKEITQDIIGAAFEVYKILGYGFLEKVYQRAMIVELTQRGRDAQDEFPIKVQFKGINVGDYYADLFVDEKVIVGLKVAKEYNPKDEAQLLNELKATKVDVGILINFGEKSVQFKRMVY